MKQELHFCPHISSTWARTSMILRQCSSPVCGIAWLISYREKGRIPAWCDRILRKGDNLRQIDYNSAPLRFSDHRPVYAIFECTVNVINESLKDSLSRTIYEARRDDVAGIIANSSNDVDEEDLIGYDSIAPGLPPASSDRRKWWLNNGKLSSSGLQRWPSSDHQVNFSQ